MHSALISPPLHGTRIRIVNRPDLENVARLDRSCMPMLADMQRHGMRVDRALLHSLYKKLTSEMEELERQVAHLSGKQINIGSGDQLSDLLFHHLRGTDGKLLHQNGREKWTRSRKRLAADSDVLKAMVSQHPAIRPILEWKEREKLRSTYTLSLVAKLDSDDRLHTDLGTVTAETGRINSSSPNLQNIPIRTMLGRMIRDAFIPKPGNVIGAVDASQIEMRQMCHDAQCPNMMDIFWSYQDFYWQTAELMCKQKFPDYVRKCGCPDGKHVKGCVTCGIEKTIINAPGQPYHGLSYKSWYRFNAKTTALMTAYATSPGGLYDQFLVTAPDVWQQSSQEEGERLCAEQIRDYFTAYPELLSRQKEHHKRAFRYMFAWCMFGRIRWIPQVKSSLPYIVSEGLRAAGNMPGQGGAAGIIKLWMAILQRQVDSFYAKHGLMMLMQVHDELVVEGPRSVVEGFLEYAAHVLRNLFVKSEYQEFYSVPLDAEWEVGDRWGQLKD